MIKDSVIDNELFTDEYDSAPIDDKLESRLEQAGVTYPSFCPLPEPTPRFSLAWDSEAGCYTITDEDKNTQVSFPTIREAKSFVNRGRCEVDENITDSPEVDHNIGGIVILPGGEGLIFQSVDKRQWEIRHYHGWLCLVRAWLQDQDNFALAYNFLSGHPIFWYKTEHSEPWIKNAGATTSRTTFWHKTEDSDSWIKNAGVSTFRTAVFSDEEGVPSVALEAGSSVPGEFTQHYHDIDLDVYASSFEEAYVKMAKLVHEKFSLDGEERKPSRSVKFIKAD